MCRQFLKDYKYLCLLNLSSTDHQAKVENVIILKENVNLFSSIYNHIYRPMCVTLNSYFYFLITNKTRDKIVKWQREEKECNL